MKSIIFLCILIAIYYQIYKRFPEKLSNCTHLYFGTFVTGGSTGNLLGMLAAIYHYDPNLKEDGIFGSNVLTGFVSEESHYSFLKAAHQLNPASV